MAGKTKKQLLVELEELATQLNIKIRYEKTAARGGLCHHDGRHMIIIDSKVADDFKIDLIAAALKTFDLSDIFISPKIRDLLDK